MAGYPNMFCKLSGLVTEANLTTWSKEDLRPFVDRALELFGPQRLMFGSDWPVCHLAASYSQVLDCFQSILQDLSEQERARIFDDNATEFYQLHEGLSASLGSS